jgi:hypothetical protein
MLLPSAFCLQRSACGARLLSALFLLFAALPAAASSRDPFWPIGYEPPKPEPQVAEAPPPVIQVARPQEPPPKPQPPAIKPITEADWANARKALFVSGFTQSSRPDTGETRTQVMINRRTFSAGDTLSVTNLDIHFTWRIESLANRDLKLKQVKAARVAASPSPSPKQ